MYAPQVQPFPAAVSLRLIGVLDTELVDAFVALQRELHGSADPVVIVDVRDLQIFREADLELLVHAVREARIAGRDVRFDAHGLPWRRAAKKHLSAVPPIDAKIRSAVRRTVILAHSARKQRR